MKNKIFNLAVIFFFLGIMSGFAQSETEEFKVYGNCGMCENRIENAATAVAGVSSAEWDSETEMLKVSFDKKKTDTHKIQMAIAKVGHDTDMHKADDAVYDDLPGCCQYERLTGDANRK